MTFLNEETAEISELIADIEAGKNADAPSHAAKVEKGVPIYDVRIIGSKLTGAERQLILSEWADVLENGAGVLVLKGALADLDAVDAATDVFNQLIAQEAEAAGGGADHFAAAGNNSRIWNSAQKLCLHAPEVFANYHRSVALDAVCEAWLGPAYQVTGQVNVVRPGGAAQEAHRDYHLGFQTADEAAKFPAHVHAFSSALTLQGAVAHCDMPIESGTTKLLPHSQNWLSGYVAMRRPDVRSLFEERCVQLPLEKGDGLFFNPALFHGAGANISSNIQRMANLLQVSSGFGRAMETLDRIAMVKALFPVLRAADFSAAEKHAVIAASAKGYPFPTNLDNDPPVGGLAPESQAGLFARALDQDMSEADLADALAAQSSRQSP